MDKAGCGTYMYPSKARYEGEWQDNAKEGFGIYYYPKGGLYKVPIWDLPEAPWAPGMQWHSL
jgi:MORN repeat